MKDHDDWDLDGLIEERQIPLWFGELPFVSTAIPR